MATEPIQGGPYPVPGDAPDGPSQIKGVADWAATRLNMRFASTAARDAAIPTPVAGMECAIGSGVSQVKYIYTGTTWADLWVPVSQRDTGRIPLTLVSGYTGTLAICRLNGVAHLMGQVTRTAGQFDAAYTTIAQIPAGFTPPDYLRLPLAGYASPSAANTLLLVVNGANLQVGVAGASSSTAYFNGISWLLR